MSNRRSTSQMKIDPRRLLELLAVARHGSISKAAEVLNMSQPALSQSIAVLEHELKLRVLERGRHGARLNVFGESMVFHAQSLEGLLARATEDIRMRALGLEGSLAIGVTPVSAVDIVPRSLEVLIRDTPGVSVSVIEGLDRELIQMLRIRELDLLVTRLGAEPRHPDIEQEKLFTTNWYLITAPSHALASQGGVRVSDLKDVQWVLPAVGSIFREQIEIVFSSLGLAWPRRGISTNSILSIKSMVMNSNCVSIISPPLVQVEVAAGRLRLIRLKEVSPLPHISLMWRRGEQLPPIAARFAKIIRTIAAQDAEPSS